MKSVLMILAPLTALALLANLIGCEQTARSSGNLVATSRAEDPNARIVILKDGTADVSFDSLKFDIQPNQDYVDSMLPAEIKALDGKSIVIRGFILPGSVYRDTGIKQFVLIRDNQQCCFGPGAKLYHNMQVELQQGKSTRFSTFPVTVKGEFHVRPWHAPDGKCYSVYHLTAQSVAH